MVVCLTQLIIDNVRKFKKKKAACQKKNYLIPCINNADRQQSGFSYLDPALQMLFDFAKRNFTAMKYTGSQSSVSPGMFKQFGEMLSAACAAGCNNRYADRPFYRVNQLKVKTVAGSVTVNAVKQNLTGPELLACSCKGYSVNRPPLAPALDGAFIPAPALAAADLQSQSR